MNTFTKDIHKQYTRVRNLSVQHGGDAHARPHTHSHIQWLRLASEARARFVLQTLRQVPSLTHCRESHCTQGGTAGTMYTVSFRKYCTYWPIASHSECHDNAHKYATQSDIYLYTVYTHYRILETYAGKSGLVSCTCFF